MATQRAKPAELTMSEKMERVAEVVEKMTPEGRINLLVKAGLISSQGRRAKKATHRKKRK